MQLLNPTLLFLSYSALPGTCAFQINNEAMGAGRVSTVLFTENDSKPTPEQLGFDNSASRDVSRAQDQLNQQQQKVRVDIVEDVDPFNLTAIGFALIAINFFVLANLGDGGIAGVVATIINTMNQ